MFKKTWKHTSETTSKSFKNGARRPPETASEKHPPKNNTKIEKYRKCMILGCPKNKEATKNGRTFITFSAAGVPGTPLGHPREPKWSQDLPQESPGPLWASILHDCCVIFAASSYSFCRFVGLVSARHPHEKTKHAEGTHRKTTLHFCNSIAMWTLDTRHGGTPTDSSQDMEGLPFNYWNFTACAPFLSFHQGLLRNCLHKTTTSHSGSWNLTPTYRTWRHSDRFFSGYGFFPFNYSSFTASPHNLFV